MGLTDFVIISDLHRIIAAQDVTLEVIEPDPASQPFPCPNQTVVYECTVDGYIGLTWVLPTSDTTTLVFTQGNIVGDTNTALNGQFSATLTNSERITGSNPVVNLMTSTLLINPPLNGLALTCLGSAAVGGEMDGMVITNITISGE